MFGWQLSPQQNCYLQVSNILHVWVECKLSNWDKLSDWDKLSNWDKLNKLFKSSYVRSSLFILNLHFRYGQSGLQFPGVEDVYTKMGEMGDYFDFSNYLKNHPLYSITNKKVAGKFKDFGQNYIALQYYPLLVLLKKNHNKGYKEICKR